MDNEDKKRIHMLSVDLQKDILKMAVEKYFHLNLNSDDMFKVCMVSISMVMTSFIRSFEVTEHEDIIFAISMTIRMLLKEKQNSYMHFKDGELVKEGKFN